MKLLKEDAKELKLKANHNCAGSECVFCADAKELKLKANHNETVASLTPAADAKELKLKANHNVAHLIKFSIQMQKN